MWGGIAETEFFSRHEGRKLIKKQAFGTGGGQVSIVEITKKSVIEGNIPISHGDYLNSIARPNITWLFQKNISQHPIMAKFNESSVNTLRIVTVHTGKRVVVLMGYLRFGKPGNVVDNVSAGGWELKICKDGKTGNTMYSRENKLDRFVEIEIPFYEECRQLAISLHQAIPQLFTVGWDIAITENGPVVIEGNDGWDPESQVNAGRGLRKEYEMLLDERERYYGEM